MKTPAYMVGLRCVLSGARALGLAGLLGLAGAAQAAEVTNTARLEFTQGSVQRTVASNTVRLTVVSAPSPGKVVFRRAADNGYPAGEGQCRTADGQWSLLSTKGSSDSKAAPADASATPPATGVYHAGDPILITLADADRNRDGAVREIIELTVSTPDGDEEQLRLKETGADTGVFAATLPSVAIPPQPTRFDCQLSVRSGLEIDVHYQDPLHPLDTSEAVALVDPYGFVFASNDGQVVDGARVTMVDAATGQPAKVFGDDGVSSYPSTVVSGGAAKDSAGRAYDFPPGGYRFPLAASGAYRLVVEPPTGFKAPSARSVEALADLRDPEGARFALQDGSYARPFVLVGPAPLKVDIPVDRLGSALALEKAASVATASAGDFVQYRVTLSNADAEVPANGVTLTDTLPVGLSFRASSFRRDKAKIADPAFSADGRSFTLAMDSVPAGKSVEISYIVLVDGAAKIGDAINTAIARADGRAVSNEAQAGVRIEEPLNTGALTIVGRVTAGACDAKKRDGVAGVRMVLETGAFVITDRDGQYHFEGVHPGTHVVQIDEASLPKGAVAAPCTDTTRRAGRAFSQFVEAQGGSLQRADFHLRLTEAEGKASATPAKVGDAEAAGGGDRDWLAGAEPGIAWLFPQADHNPRAPTVRAVIKHAPGQSVALSLNGQPVDPLAFDGVQASAERGVAVSVWRGLPLKDGDTVLTAEVKGPNGEVVERLSRTVHYANAPARAEVDLARSRLIADGRTRPAIAVRLLDRAGRPIRAGASGTVGIGAPYSGAVDLNDQQQRQLAGLTQTRPTWKIEGDDGVAMVELAPTTQSGLASLTFEFDRDGVRTTQELTAWLTADREEWMVVGFAKGTMGYETLSRNAQAGGDPSDAITDGQVSLYAKGRVLGRWLLTLAYDSDKGEGTDRRTSLLSTIDPGRYYTLYGDGSEQGYDASSQQKLYLRLERGQFYALFGDYETGLTQTELSRYSRTLQGVKTEFQGRIVSFNAFAADTGQRFAREEIQGSGLSGLYRLGRRDIVMNSDKVRIEVRDRLRSEIIVSSETLTRHIDYDVDYAIGTLTFRRPIPSRDSDLNPVFVVVEYETVGSNDRVLNGGGRVAAKLKDVKVEVGASAIHDADGQAETNLVGVDVTLKPRADTEIRLEAAHTDSSDSRGTAGAYLAELEHHGARFDALAYVRQQDVGFGVGQQNAAEAGSRKFGVDGRVKLGRRFSLVGAAWRETNLATDAERDAAEARLEYRTENGSLRVGTQFAEDRVGDQTLRSTLVTLGAGHSFLNKKLDLDAQTSFALGGNDDAVDFPTRYRLGAAYAVRDDLRVLLTHEISQGEQFDSSTTSLGLDAEPWKGGRFLGVLNNDIAAENAGRVYANLGLAQSWTVNDHLSVDAAVDSSTTFNGQPTNRDGLSVDQPISSGGYIGSGTLAEDFVAVSTGATWRAELWGANGRIERREGELTDQTGLTINALRQTESGVAFASAVRAYETRESDGGFSRLASLDLSAAYRPLDSRWSVLNKLELQYDEVADAGAVAAPGLYDGTLAAGSDARSSRIINNFAINRTAESEDAPNFDFGQRSQLSLYYGAKYVFSRFDKDDYSGFTDVVRAEARIDLTRRFDIGLHGGALHNWESGSVAWTAGVSVGVSPLENAWFSVGWNFAGFDDRDFDDAGYTRQGPFATLRFKFDQDSAGGLARLLKRR